MKRTLKSALKGATGLDVTRKDIDIYARYPGTSTTKVLLRFGNTYVTQSANDLTLPAAYTDTITDLPGQGVQPEE